MSSRICVMPDSLGWKQAYMSAILEKDRSRIPGLIADAKERLALRLLELTALGLVRSDEVEAIHDASYILDALHSSLAYREECA